MDSVGFQDLLNPGHEGCDSGIHGRSGSGAETTAPRHNACQGPDSILLADEGATRVTLQRKVKGLIFKPDKDTRTWWDARQTVGQFLWVH